jgi:DNA (cytosine-5)-methyltransferase 1
MNEISLCTGIGGFGLAARWMGWQSVATCEIEPFCQRVLKKNFPKAYHHDNLFTLTADTLETKIKKRFGPEWRKPGVILTAGLPCQPFSVAGERNGQNDPRFLWPTAIGLVRELRPDVLLFENVAGLLSILEPDSVSEVEREAFELFDQDNNQCRKIVERIERRIIGRIITDIEQAGYILPRSKDGTPIIFCVPACAVEAIHQRDRVWIVAYAASQQNIGENVGQFQRKPSRNNTRFYPNPKSTVGQRARASWAGRNGYTDACGDIGGVHSNASSRGCQNGRHGAQQESNRQTGQHGNSDRRPFRQVEWQPNNTSEILRVSYGVPGGLDGRVRNRNARIKACGNAIVPQVAYAIFQAIDAALKNKRP